MCEAASTVIFVIGVRFQRFYSGQENAALELCSGEKRRFGTSRVWFITVSSRLVRQGAARGLIVRYANHKKFIKLLTKCRAELICPVFSILKSIFINRGDAKWKAHSEN